MTEDVATLATLQAELADVERRVIRDLKLMGHDELLLRAGRNELPDTDLVARWYQLHDLVEHLRELAD